MSDKKELRQPWRSIGLDHLDNESKTDGKANRSFMLGGTVGQVILQGGSGTGSLDASTWKTVFYDTGDKIQPEPAKASKPTESTGEQK